MNGTETIADVGPYPYTSPMTGTLIGYARCSTDRQDLAAQRQALAAQRQALAAVRQGDTLNRSQCENYICGAKRVGLGVAN